MMLSSDLFALARWFGDAPRGVTMDATAAQQLAGALRKAGRDAAVLERRAGIDNVVTFQARRRSREPNPWAGPTGGGDAA